MKIEKLIIKKLAILICIYKIDYKYLIVINYKMGIDNDSRLVFGFILSEEDCEKMENIVGDVFWDCDKTYDSYNDLNFGYASPWYDSDIPDRVYFISINDPCNTEMSLDELSKLLNSWDNSQYRQCLNDLGIPFEEPKLYSLPLIY